MTQHTGLAFVATNDLFALTRGRALPLAELSATSGVGWVPADLAINAFGHLVEPNPFGALGDLRLIPDMESRAVIPLPTGSLEMFLADQTLREYGSREPTLVFVAIRRPQRGTQIRPSADEIFQPGDVVIVVGTPDAVARMLARAEGAPAQPITQ